MCHRHQKGRIGGCVRGGVGPEGVQAGWGGVTGGLQGATAGVPPLCAGRQAEPGRPGRRLLPCSQWHLHPRTGHCALGERQQGHLQQCQECCTHSSAPVVPPGHYGLDWVQQSGVGWIRQPVRRHCGAQGVPHHGSQDHRRRQEQAPPYQSAVQAANGIRVGSAPPVNVASSMKRRHRTRHQRTQYPSIHTSFHRLFTFKRALVLSLCFCSLTLDQVL
mmetsp:Transcript_1903/g.5642  ORF Transcript_1903/g.5642 Transcript_1903/m.5642 type:complete len:218 (-) Transcript_1903:343-996(-)